MAVRREAWLPHSPAIFASSFHPHKGGVEELVRQLALHQREAGALPIVHTMRWPRDLPARELWDRLEIRRHSYRIPERTARQFATAAVANPVVLAAVVRQLRQDRSDLVHVQCVSHGAWFAFQAAKVLRLPFVVTLQGELTMDADDVYRKSPLLRHTLRLLLRRADVVTACSHATLQEAEVWYGSGLGDRGIVVYNGVEVSEFDSPVSPSRHSQPFVLAIGRNVAQKGFDVLIAAFGMLARSAEFDWDLVLAGDGPEHGALVAQAERLEIKDRVHFVGRVDRAEAVALFREASAFVLPSRHEPFGIVNLEAMAASTPVVATRVGGVPEFVIDGANGIVVDPEDASALAAAISRLAADPELRAKLAAAGRTQAARFDWPQIESEYRNVYGRARYRHDSVERRG